MMQSLLADRFQLKTHQEKREFAVYVLVAGKPSPQLKESPPDSNAEEQEPKGAVNVTAGGSADGIGVSLGRGASFTLANNRFEARRLTMDNLAYTLEWYADRQIIDMTGMAGHYDFAVDFTPEDYRAMMIQAGINAGAQMPAQVLRQLEGHSSASLGDALQQIGLRLEARRMPLDVIVIDGASKTPAGN